jgi:hypothetical protein
LAIRDRRRVERRVATSFEKCRGENLVPAGLGEGGAERQG